MSDDDDIPVLRDAVARRQPLKLSPEEIEAQITFPIEQAISGLPGLDQVRSLSKFGLSQVTVLFADGTDILRARQLVTERFGLTFRPTAMK